MYTRILSLRFIRIVVFVLAGATGARFAAAQTPSPSPEQHQHGGPAPDADQDEHDVQMAREGSGTAWLPDASPMYAIHWQRGPWQFMAHDNAFLQFLHESGDRGDDQFGSINWIMGMAQRKTGKGRVMMRGMFR